MQNLSDVSKSRHCYPYSPWLSSSLAASPAVAPVTFASIVEEERQQEAALIRSREKPLALIQVNDILRVRPELHFNPRSLGVSVLWFSEAVSNAAGQAGL